eukprot:CFRG4679T1
MAIIEIDPPLTLMRTLLDAWLSFAQSTSADVGDKYISIHSSWPVGRTTSPDVRTFDSMLEKMVIRAIESSNTGPHEALTAINYRLSLRIPSVNILALILLQSCMVSCGRRFHVRAIHSETIRCVGDVAMLKSKVGTMACEILQIWYVSFLNVAEHYRPLYECYAELRMNEIEFPHVEPDKYIHIEGVIHRGSQNELLKKNKTETSLASTTPSLATTTTALVYTRSPTQISASTHTPAPMPTESPGSPPRLCKLVDSQRVLPIPRLSNMSVMLEPGQLRPPNKKVIPRPDQLEKARTDLSLVESHVDLLVSLLTQVPADICPTKSTLITSVYTTAKQMCTKIHYLIQRIDHEKLMEELLWASDKLSVGFKMYEHACAFATVLGGDKRDSSALRTMTKNASSTVSFGDEEIGYLGRVYDEENFKTNTHTPALMDLHNKKSKDNETRPAQGRESHNRLKCKRSESMPSFHNIRNVQSCTNTSNESVRKSTSCLRVPPHHSSTEDLMEVQF